MERAEMKDVHFPRARGPQVSHASFWISATPHPQHTSLLTASFYLYGFIYKGLSLVLVKIKSF